MKLKYVAAAFAAMSVSAFGAIITVKNVDGPVLTQSVVDNSGAAIDGGFAAIGSLDETVLVGLTSGSDLASAFTVFGGGEAAITSAPFLGTYAIDSNGALDDVAGNPIYLVLGNGADLASSTQAGVLKVGNFPAAEPAVADFIVKAANSEVLLGDFTSFVLNPGPVPIAANNPAFALANIPEPSSSLLIGLAGLSLLIRRRR